MSVAQQIHQQRQEFNEAFEKVIEACPDPVKQAKMRKAQETANRIANIANEIVSHFAKPKPDFTRLKRALRKEIYQMNRPPVPNYPKGGIDLSWAENTADGQPFTSHPFKAQ